MNMHRLHRELFPPCVNLSRTRSFLIKHSSAVQREASATFAGVSAALPLAEDSQRSKGARCELLLQYEMFNLTATKQQKPGFTQSRSSNH